MSDTLRIGFIGAGENTRIRHLPGFQAIEQVSCEVVCNRSVASAQRVADAFGVPRVAEHWLEVVTDPELDAICIGTWPYLHAEATVAALEAGKHVLCEARMAMNLAEAEAMYSAHQRNPHLVAQLVPAPLSFGFDAYLRDFAAAQPLREIIVTHWLDMNANASAPMNWRQNRVLSGNNCMTMGILYETVRRWLGDRDPVWVQAQGKGFTPTRLDVESQTQIPVTIPETLQVCAGYADGLSLNLNISGLAIGKSRFDALINAKEQSLYYDMANQTLDQHSLAGTSTPITPDPQAVWRVEADFIDSIRKGTPIQLTGFADGLRYMRFTERVASSLLQSGSRQDW